MFLTSLRPRSPTAPRRWAAPALARLCALALSLGACLAQAQELVIGTVNNGHMLMLQKLAPEFERAHPGVRIRWVTLEENLLRQQLTRDVVTQGGAFDLVTIGAYEALVWSARGWLQPIRPSAAYDVADLLPAVRESLTHQGQLYALPFYGESTMTMVRTDLLKQAGIQLPARPSWEQIARAARRLHAPEHDVAGICLRGKPGWGENMALLSIMANAHGGQWFDLHWRPQLNRAPWKQAVALYADLLRHAGPPGAAANGYNENLALFSAGRCAIWVDATVAGSFLNDPAGSRVAGRVGYLPAPVASTTKGSHWLWTWSLAIPARTKQAALAQAFAEWATSRAYVRLVAQEAGWGRVPSGTRASTYEEAAFRQANPQADIEREAIASARQNDPTLPRSPYVGIQWVGIPEFQAIGTTVGQLIHTLLLSEAARVDTVLNQAQSVTERKVRDSGYLRD